MESAYFTSFSSGYSLTFTYAWPRLIHFWYPEHSIQRLCSFLFPNLEYLSPRYSITPQDGVAASHQNMYKPWFLYQSIIYLIIHNHLCKYLNNSLNSKILENRGGCVSLFILVDTQLIIIIYKYVSNL